MRIRQKELRARRNRKEKRIKELVKEAIGLKKGPASKTLKASAEPKSPKKVATKATSDQPKRAPKAKKAEAAVEPVEAPATE